MLKESVSELFLACQQLFLQKVAIEKYGCIYRNVVIVVTDTRDEHICEHSSNKAEYGDLHGR